MIASLKLGASRSLSEALGEPSGTRRWTRGGSKRYLWKLRDLLGAVDYVLNRQGSRLEAYEKPEWTALFE